MICAAGRRPIASLRRAVGVVAVVAAFACAGTGTDPARAQGARGLLLLERNAPLETNGRTLFDAPAVVHDGDTLVTAWGRFERLPRREPCPAATGRCASGHGDTEGGYPGLVELRHDPQQREYLSELVRAYGLVALPPPASAPGVTRVGVPVGFEAQWGRAFLRLPDFVITSVGMVPRADRPGVDADAAPAISYDGETLVVSGRRFERPADQRWCIHRPQDVCSPAFGTSRAGWILVAPKRFGSAEVVRAVRDHGLLDADTMAGSHAVAVSVPLFFESQWAMALSLHPAVRNVLVPKGSGRPEPGDTGLKAEEHTLIHERGGVSVPASMRARIIERMHSLSRSDWCGRIRVGIASHADETERPHPDALARARGSYVREMLARHRPADRDRILESPRGSTRRVAVGGVARDARSDVTVIAEAAPRDCSRD